MLHECRHKLAATEEKLYELEKLNQRLKEVFGAKTQEFRQACYELTGYKMTMLPCGTKYRLRSMYAEREEDDLSFQVPARRAHHAA